LQRALGRGPALGNRGESPFRICGKPSGGQQPRDLLGVPTVSACRGPHAARASPPSNRP